MTDEEKVQEVTTVVQASMKHYRIKGGNCLMCGAFTHKSIMVAFQNEEENTMGPFAIVPLCEPCITINTDGSTTPLANKIQQKIKEGRAKVIRSRKEETS